MKKIAVLFAVLLFALPAVAQTWHQANQVTLAWTAVAPVAPTDTIVYQVYSKFGSAAAVPQAVGGEIAVTQQAVTFSAEGRYFLCAETVRYPQGETVAIRSGLSCSDVAEVTAAGVPFGVVYYVAPGQPLGLRLAP